MIKRTPDTLGDNYSSILSLHGPGEVGGWVGGVQGGADKPAKGEVYGLPLQATRCMIGPWALRRDQLQSLRTFGPPADSERASPSDPSVAVL